MTTTLRSLAAAGLLGLIAFGAWVARPSGELRDFGSFVASGRAAAEGADPYGIHPLTFRVSLPGFDIANPNLNPPISVALFQVIGAFDPARSVRLWWAVSLLCYLLAVAALLRRYGLRRCWFLGIWALALAGFWDTLALGQIYLPLVLAGVTAWLLLERGRDIHAGLLIGVVIAVKPNFGTWPLLLLLAGSRRTAAVAIATAGGLWLLPTFVYGPGIYGQWAELVLTDRGRSAFLTNASLIGLAARLGLEPAGLTAAVTLLAVSAVWARRARPDAMHVSAVALAVGILASPIAWVHYTLFLLPVFFARRLSAPLVAAAVLLVVPVPVMLRTLEGPLWHQVTFGSVYSWAMLCVLAALASAAVRMPSAERAVAARPYAAPGIGAR